jgi:chromosome segregation ATPase
MITLDQIKQLDFKVRKAIDKINSLSSENNLLQEKLDNYQLRIEELEILIDTFKEDQGEIEDGIIDALNQLDILDDDSKEEDSKEETSSLYNTSSEQEEKSTEDLSLNDNNSTVETPEGTDTKDDGDQIPPDNESIDEKTEESGNSEIELDIF